MKKKEWDNVINFIALKEKRNEIKNKNKKVKKTTRKKGVKRTEN